MLSRLHCLKGSNLVKHIRQTKVPVAYAATCKTKVSKTGAGFSQRDLVNFPRPTRLENIPPVVFGFIPKSWFDFFYTKTGVTGGYTFLFVLGVYLLSKELFVINSEFVMFTSFITMCTVIQRCVPEIREFFEKEQMEELKLLDSGQEANKKAIRDEIQQLKKKVWEVEGIVSMLPEAKRENVHLQQEAIYRTYLKEVHLAVLHRLNYNVEKATIERAILGKHLISWILHSVEAGITPEVRKVALEKAISDLKGITATQSR